MIPRISIYYLLQIANLYFANGVSKGDKVQYIQFVENHYVEELHICNFFSKISCHI